MWSVHLPPLSSPQEIFHFPRTKRLRWKKKKKKILKVYKNPTIARWPPGLIRWPIKAESERACECFYLISCRPCRPRDLDSYLAVIGRRRVPTQRGRAERDFHNDTVQSKSPSRSVPSTEPSCNQSATRPAAGTMFKWDCFQGYFNGLTTGNSADAWIRMMVITILL